MHKLTTTTVHLLGAAGSKYFLNHFNHFFWLFVPFKVLLANPIETPKITQFGFLISAGLETRVIINPSIREASHSLQRLPVYQRQCYFSNERYLQYYRWFFFVRGCLNIQSVSKMSYKIQLNLCIFSDRTLNVTAF